MEYYLNYGTGKIRLNVPDSCAVDVYTPRKTVPLADPLAALDAALNQPVSAPPIEKLPEPSSVAIAVPDETRPFPTRLLLPLLLQRIFEAYPRLPHENIHIVIGGGLHEPANGARLKRILPDDLHGCTVTAHDALHSPMRLFGHTSRGTPVEINAVYASAQLRIVMGMVDVHQFVGYTGGAKGVVVGCASAAMIAASHKMLVRADSGAGKIDGNPIREDMDEAGKIAGVQFAVNAVMTQNKEIAAIYAGDPPQVMRLAAKRVRELYGLRLQKRYDIVVASCGGFPKDICLYQAQKALTPAAECSLPGGKILLLAQCAEGVGDERYAEYVGHFASQQELLRDFSRRPFAIGPHKAFLYARTATAHELVLHTDLPFATLRHCLLRGQDAQKTLDCWLDKAPDSGIAILTHANSTLFYE